MSREEAACKVYIAAALSNDADRVIVVEDLNAFAFVSEEYCDNGFELVQSFTCNPETHEPFDYEEPVYTLWRCTVE